MNLYKEKDVQNIKSYKFDFLELDETDHVFTITLDRPKKKNALHPQMINEIAFAMHYAHFNNSIRVVLFRANGDVFCSGMDLKAMAGDIEKNNSTIPQPNSKILIGELFNKLYKPKICQLNSDVYAGGIKGNESLTFLPTAADGCRMSNCMNATFNLTVDAIPRPTPTPIPPTPTPLPTVNPSLYSGQIAIGSGTVPDGIEVYAKIQDYISETVLTKDGGYSITVNPITINYVNQPIQLVIQGNESISSIPFQENQFVTGVNFLFADFELKLAEPESTPTPEPLPTPKPETIIVVATPTPSKIEPIAANKVEQEPVAPVAEGGGCSDGGGSSSISLFSVLTLGLLVVLSKRLRKPILARIRL